MPFTFVDLFSGIGGFHRGCIKNGGKCVAACEIDPYARDIYKENYGIIPHDDVRTMTAISGLDLVCAGFPCQSHSTLGFRKGFKDGRGRLFNDLCRFIGDSRPRAFLLENVKGLVLNSTFKRHITVLRRLGYIVSWAVLDSREFGVPQHRERVYIVGALDGGGSTFTFDTLLAASSRVTLRSILDKKLVLSDNLDCHIFDNTPFFEPPKITSVGFILRAQRSNFTNRKLFSTDGVIGTIATGSPPPIYDEAKGRVRHLSKTELLRAQGFPASLVFPGHVVVSRSTVLHYVGNAVTVPVIAAIVAEMRKQKLF